MDNKEQWRFDRHGADGVMSQDTEHVRWPSECGPGILCAWWWGGRSLLDRERTCHPYVSGAACLPSTITRPRSCDCVARRSSCRWDSQKRLQWLASVLDETRRNEASPYRRVAVCGSCGRDTGEIAPPDPVPARRLGWKNRVPSTSGASEGRSPRTDDAVATCKWTTAIREWNASSK